jgi:hypothetical protein
MPFSLAGFCLFAWQDSGGFALSCSLPKVDRRLISTDEHRLDAGLAGILP